MSSLHQRGEEGAEWVGWVSGVFLIFKVVGKMVVKAVVVVDVHVVPRHHSDWDPTPPFEVSEDLVQMIEQHYKQSQLKRSAVTDG